MISTILTYVYFLFYQDIQILLTNIMLSQIFNIFLSHCIQKDSWWLRSNVENQLKLRWHYKIRRRFSQKILSLVAYLMLLILKLLLRAELCISCTWRPWAYLLSSTTYSPTMMQLLTGWTTFSCCEKTVAK